MKDINLKKVRKKRVKTHLGVRRIEINPKIVLGKPIIRGTRLTVDFILKLFAEGMTHDQILKEYPQLEKEDLIAVLNYAKNIVQDEHIYPLSDLKVKVSV